MAEHLPADGKKLLGIIRGTKLAMVEMRENLRDMLLDFLSLKGCAYKEYYMILRLENAVNIDLKMLLLAWKP